jgi:hypothetical protein
VVRTASKIAQTASSAMSSRSSRIKEKERMEGQLWGDIPGMLKAFTAPCVCCCNRLFRIK